jgi:hypothetical protein
MRVNRLSSADDRSCFVHGRYLNTHQHGHHTGVRSQGYRA